MTRLKLVTGAVASVLMAGAAHSADMPVYYEQPAQEFGGWYLRGDIGVSHQISDDIDSPFFDTIDPADSIEVLRSEWDPSWFIGVGIGYQFNENFRMDVTGEYRGASDFSGFDVYDDSSTGAVIDGTNEYFGKKEEAVFLVNGYYDFAGFSTWATPYVGAGVGAAWVKLSDFRDVNAVNGAIGLSGDTETWNFAAALYAGVGFQVSERLILDVGYRFLYMGDASTEDLVAPDGSNPADNPLRFSNIMSHDVKVGLRYGF